MGVPFLRIGMGQKFIKTKLGVIGGSGLYNIEGAKVVREHRPDTPYGPPSDIIFEMLIGNRSVFFLARHGRKHHVLPSEVNYRANIFAMKKLGVTHLAGISAVGSLRVELVPGHFVIPDQLIDCTSKSRPATFLGDGLVGHFSLADPFCEEMQGLLKNSAHSKVKLHTGGTYVCIEGPQFSTRAESNFYRGPMQASIIGMTAIPEARLAREAELSYALLAMVTDYDCWHESEEDVSVESVLKLMKQNSSFAQQIVIDLIAKLPEVSSAPSLSSAQISLMTPKDQVSAATKAKLEVLYGKYFV